MVDDNNVPNVNPYMDFPEIHIPPNERLAYLLAGKSVFTVQSHHTQRAFTYRIQSGKADKSQNWSTNNQDRTIFFVSLLTGPDNSADFTYLCFISAKNPENLYLGSKDTYATAFKNFRWIFEAIRTQTHEDSFDFLPSSSCARCGRTLTVAESVRAGYGPECAGRLD